MIAQCWLHIGTEKTGSTSIRSYLAQNRSVLLAQNCLYPLAAGTTNHYALTAFGLDDSRIDSTRSGLGIFHSVAAVAFRQKFVAALQDEIAASGASTLVFSNELLSSRLRSPAEIARIKSLCDGFARNTKVVVYLRNQADFLVSRYMNIVAEGGKQEFDFRMRSIIADYSLLLERWSAAFGRENIVARRFEQMDFPGGNLLADFADTVGIDAALLSPVPRSNPSIDAESLAFLRATNRNLPQLLAKHIAPYRGRILGVLQRRRGGTKFIISPALANKIEVAFRESNKIVSDTYFRSRFHPLFSPPLLTGPVTPLTSIGPVAALRLAGLLARGLLCDLMKRRKRPPLGRAFLA